VRACKQMVADGLLTERGSSSWVPVLDGAHRDELYRLIDEKHRAAAELTTDSGAPGESDPDTVTMITAVPGADALDADLERLAAEQADAPPAEHIDLILTILEAGPQPFKLLLDDSHLSVQALRQSMDHLLSQGRIVGKAGQYALFEHTDRLDTAVTEAARPSPETALQPAILAVLGKLTKDRIEFPDLRREVGKLTGFTYDVQFMTGVLDQMLEAGQIVKVGTWDYALPAARPESTELFGPDVDAMTPHIETVRAALAKHRQQQPDNNTVLINWLKLETGLDDRLVNAACEALYNEKPQVIVGLGQDMVLIPVLPPDAPVNPALLPARRGDGLDPAKVAEHQTAIQYQVQQAKALYALVDLMPDLLRVRSIETWATLSADSLQDTRRLYAQVRQQIAKLDERLVTLDARIAEHLAAKETANDAPEAEPVA
ncbi:MAG: hypothetical protein JW910_22770, partial [Anaerolineae bacterium]|nr:hypothetical protein [Anaerolineae bacterium]